jgi:7-cyano-7-deazaguanine synthase
MTAINRTPDRAGQATDPAALMAGSPVGASGLTAFGPHPALLCCAAAINQRSGIGMDDQAALVLLSGGQDSTTCLGWALARFERVETIGFDYGQRNRAELAARLQVRAEIGRVFPRWSARLGADRVIELPALNAVAESALTRDVPIAASSEGGLPNTFVPGRNIVFFTFAAALAYRRGLKHLVAGMCETDYSGYPDCRDDTLKALQIAFNLGMNTRFVIHTPLM